MKIADCPTHLRLVFFLLIFLELHNFRPIFLDQTALQSTGLPCLFQSPPERRLCRLSAVVQTRRSSEPVLVTLLCWVTKSVVLGIRVATIGWLTQLLLVLPSTCKAARGAYSSCLTVVKWPKQSCTWCKHTNVWL